MISGLTPPASGISSDLNKKVKVLCFPLDGTDGPIPASDVTTYELPYSFVFHHINAFESKDQIFAYSAEMNDFPSAEQARRALDGQELHYPKTNLVNYVFDKSTGRVERRPLNYSNFELPRVRDSLTGKKFDDFYAAASLNESEFPFLTCIDKVSRDGKHLARAEFPDCLVGEPVFVPGLKKNFILVLNFNGATNKSELVLLDAENLHVVMRAQLPHSQPQGFHGNWYAD
jgi:carotenoid cleavage dioxygenase-like enzyme